MNKDTLFKIEKIKYYLLIAFVVIQPLLDIYYLYTDKIVNSIGFSPSTIIRICITAVLSILTLITLKDKKRWMIIILYCLLICIYMTIHVINAENFHSLVPGNFGYSLKGEVFYIFRMMIPLAILFITYNLDLKEADFEKSITAILLLIAGTIVITNVLKISLNSYTNEPIKANIFGWFMGAYEKYNYSSLASKGIFNFANQIAALLVLLLPVMLSIYANKQKIINLITVLITILAMIMLGTKVALFGAVVNIVVFIGILIFIRIFKKQNTLNKKNLLMIILSLIVIGGLFMKSPAINREIVARYVRINNSKIEVEGVDSKKKETIDNKIEPRSLNDGQLKNSEAVENKSIDDLRNKGMDKVSQPNKNDKKSMMEYIEKNYENLMVNEQFIKQSYPYQYDPEFWVDIINLPVVERLNWRNLEQKMLQRVMDINDNKMDKYFGLTFTRTQNIFNLERDFLSQYYSLGIVGVLLILGPYVILALICFFKMIFKFKDKFNTTNASLTYAILFALAVSYYSGNVLDALTVTIILAFILGYLTSLVFQKTVDEKGK
ncbi:MAG: O-antigen ligase family protein [Paeniclostridium sordellii]|nr:O-antigen ligase family protein [Paeniclostridium sordellii]